MLSAPGAFAHRAWFSTFRTSGPSGGDDAGHWYKRSGVKLILFLDRGCADLWAQEANGSLSR